MRRPSLASIGSDSPIRHLRRPSIVSSAEEVSNTLGRVLSVMTTASRGTASTQSRTSSRMSLVKMGGLSAPEVMRATPLSLILRRFGNIFEGRCGDQATYELSEPASEIDWFISHNWVTPRTEKFFALALFFNSRSARLLAYATMIVFFFLSAFCDLPRFTYGDGRTRGLYCTLIGPVVFLVAVILTPDITGACCPSRAQPRTFLDKVCVHQVDPVLKRQGIESIGAFLHRSRGMVIVYTDMYFQKLWTVYEVASVMLLNPDIKMGFVPTMYPKMILSYMTVVFALAMTAQTCSIEALEDVVGEHRSAFLLSTCVVVWLFTLGAMFTAHGWNKKLAHMFSELQNFHVHAATCFCEEDRPLVLSNVAGALHELGIVDKTSSKEEALLAFDAMVQQELPQMISSLVGRAGIRYEYVLIAFIPCFGWSMDAVAAMIYDKAATAGQLVFTLFVELIISFSLWPNLLAIMVMSAWCCLKTQGTAEIALVVLKSTWVCFACGALSLVVELFPQYSWAKALYLLAHTIATVIIYQPKAFKLRRGGKRVSASWIDQITDEDEADPDLSSSSASSTPRSPHSLDLDDGPSADTEKIHRTPSGDSRDSLQRMYSPTSGDAGKNPYAPAKRMYPPDGLHGEAEKVSGASGGDTNTNFPDGPGRDAAKIPGALSGDSPERMDFPDVTSADSEKIPDAPSGDIHMDYADGTTRDAEKIPDAPNGDTKPSACVGEAPEDEVDPNFIT